MSPRRSGEGSDGPPSDKAQCPAPAETQDLKEDTVKKEPEKKPAVKHSSIPMVVSTSMAFRPPVSPPPTDGEAAQRRGSDPSRVSHHEWKGPEGEEVPSPPASPGEARLESLPESGGPGDGQAQPAARRASLNDDAAVSGKSSPAPRSPRHSSAQGPRGSQHGGHRRAYSHTQRRQGGSSSEPHERPQRDEMGPRPPQRRSNHANQGHHGTYSQAQEPRHNSHMPTQQASMYYAPMPQAPMPQAPMPQAPMPQAPMPQAPMPQAPMPQVMEDWTMQCWNQMPPMGCPSPHKNMPQYQNHYPSPHMYPGYWHPGQAPRPSRPNHVTEASRYYNMQTPQPGPTPTPSEGQHARDQSHSHGNQVQKDVVQGPSEGNGKSPASSTTIRAEEDEHVEPAPKPTNGDRRVPEGDLSNEDTNEKAMAKYVSSPSQATVESMAKELHAIKHNVDQALSNAHEIHHHQMKIDKHLQTMRREVEVQVESLRHISANFDRSARDVDAPEAEFENLVLIASARNSKIGVITSKMKGVVQQFDKFNQALVTLLGQPASNMAVGTNLIGGRAQPESILLNHRLGIALSFWDDLKAQFGLPKEDLHGDGAAREDQDQPGDKLEGDRQQDSGSAEASRQNGSQRQLEAAGEKERAAGKPKAPGDASENSYVEALKGVELGPGEIVLMRLDEPEAPTLGDVPTGTSWQKTKKKQKGKKH